MKTVNGIITARIREIKDETDFVRRFLSSADGQFRRRSQLQHLAEVSQRRQMRKQNGRGIILLIIDIESGPCPLAGDAKTGDRPVGLREAGEHALSRRLSGFRAASRERLEAQALSNAAFSFLMSSFFIFHISNIMASFFALFWVVTPAVLIFGWKVTVLVALL